MRSTKVADLLVMKRVVSLGLLLLMVSCSTAESTAPAIQSPELAVVEEPHSAVEFAIPNSAPDGLPDLVDRALLPDVLSSAIELPELVGLSADEAMLWAEGSGFDEIELVPPDGFYATKLTSSRVVVFESDGCVTRAFVG